MSGCSVQAGRQTRARLGGLVLQVSICTNVPCLHKRVLRGEGGGAVVRGKPDGNGAPYHGAV